MTKGIEVMCRKCNTFASPLCKCGEVKAEKLNISEYSFKIATENLEDVQIYTVWVDKRGVIMLSYPQRNILQAVYREVPITLEEIENV